MAHAEGFEFLEQFLQTVVRHPLHSGPAVRGHQIECFRVGFQQARHEIAPPGFQIFQHVAFILKTLPGLMPSERFVNPPVIADADHGAGGILDLVHENEKFE